jgi:hypothetical protein
MAIKTTTPAAAKAKAAAPVKTKAPAADPVAGAAKPAKKEKVPKEPKERKPSPHTLARQLVMERKWTNEEIFNKVTEQFPNGKFKKAYVNIKRWDLNDAAEPGTEPYVELALDAKGKRVPKADLPKPEKKTRAKKERPDPAVDPLATVAGLKPGAPAKATPAAPSAVKGAARPAAVKFK